MLCCAATGENCISGTARAGRSGILTADSRGDEGASHGRGHGGAAGDGDGRALQEHIGGELKSGEGSWSAIARLVVCGSGKTTST